MGKLRHREETHPQVLYSKGRLPPETGIRLVGLGHSLIKVTQRLAWAVEFLNIPSHPERAGDGREQAEGKEEEKQETWGKRKR